MRLLSFLKRQPADKPKAAPPGKEAVDAVQQVRARARQRLIGAVVLVVAGVIGFPLLFATQPRPLPVDTPIEIARRDGSVSRSSGPSVVVPPSTDAPDAGTPSATPGTPMQAPVQDDPPPTPPVQAPADAPAEPPAPPDEAPAPVPAPPRPPAEKPADKPADKPARPAEKPAAKPPVDKPADRKPATRSDDARAQALLNGQDAPKPAEGGSRFVVQVGAFAEMNAAREARQKVEKLGLKTYTQVVDTPAGNRIRVRVGPFTSRADADRAAGKVKAAGLGSAVYTL